MKTTEILENDLEAFQPHLESLKRDKEIYISTKQFDKLWVINRKIHLRYKSIREIKTELNHLPLDKIIEKITGIPFSTISSGNRISQDVTNAKLLYSYFARLVQKKGFKKIGTELNIDHSTVYFHIGKTKDYIKYDREFKELFL